MNTITNWDEWFFRATQHELQQLLVAQVLHGEADLHGTLIHDLVREIWLRRVWAE